jgi:CubicO group peptidase (beta-lactamase class C family)
MRTLERMTSSVLAALLLASGGTPASGQSVSPYFPPPGDGWERRQPARVDLDPGRLAAAVAFARRNEIGWSHEMSVQLARNTAAEPFPMILGPHRDWAGSSGLILRHGYIVAEWGDTRRVDMTFSVAKSYLSTVAGLAFDNGLIPDVQRPVRELVRDGGFDSDHNAPITWHQLLNQTSEWEGTLWGKPDVADRREGRERALRDPGTFWEYNDVRVNRLALALLRVWNRPLPEVFAELVMDPIGGSETWRWYGYYNSYVEAGGRTVQSVSGGGHWGGGFWASTQDHARFAYLLLRRGMWNGKQLLSERWIEVATTPTPIRPVYGYLWWLNPNRRQSASASTGAVFARGAGGNLLYVEPEDDLVVVVRWMDSRPAVTDEFIRLVRAAVRR